MHVEQTSTGEPREYLKTNCQRKRERKNKNASTKEKEKTKMLKVCCGNKIEGNIN